MKKELFKKNNPLILLVLDGLGVAPDGSGNAMSSAKMPYWHELILKYPSATISPVLRRGQKSIDQSFSYSILGGNFFIGKKRTKPLLEILSSLGASCKIMAEPDRLPLANFFINGGDEMTGVSFFSPKKAEVDDSGFLSFSALLKELLRVVKNDSFDFAAVFTSSLEFIARRGDILAATLALEEADKMIKKIVESVLEKNGRIIITATSGQMEEMIDMKTETVNKKIPINNLPIILIDKSFEGKTKGFPEALNGDLSVCQSMGTLANLPSTILSLVNIPPGDYYQESSLI